MINIGGDPDDASYRYKMPKLVTKIEGRGNGIKTVIVNMVDIAKALHVPPSYPTKFFGFELGAQSKFNEKDERAIVNGSHNAGDLAITLQKFIQRYILCSRCGLPEITHKIRAKRRCIEIDCAACGNNGNLNWNHKLVTFIFNQQEKKKSKRVKDKKKDKVQQRRSAVNQSTSRNDVSKRREETWKTEWDFSAEATEERRKAEFNQLDMSQNDSPYLKKGEKLSDVSPATVLKHHCYVSTPTVDSIVSEVRRLQVSRGLDEPQKVKIVLEAVIDVSKYGKKMTGMMSVTEQKKNIEVEYAKNHELLKKFAFSKASQLLLIYCIEDQIGVQKPDLITRMPQVLFALYNKEVLDEETIVEWGDSPPENSWMVPKDVALKARKYAKVTVDWLKEDNDEGDSDSDEEEE